MLSNEVVLDPAQDQPETLGHLSHSEKRAIQELYEIFPEVLTPKLGLTHLIKYEIQLTDPTVVTLHPYRLAPPKMEILKHQIQELLQSGVIEPSTSPYSSPAFLVRKPGGKHRLVIDYRQLNQKMEIESVPLPDLHSAFNWFGSAKVFTMIDLNQAYHQIPLAEKSKPLTAFCVLWNLYQFTRVPFGMATGAQVLTRLLDTIFHDVKFKYVYNYLDDLLVFSESFEQHVTHLKEVLTRLRSSGLTVNPDKVKFAV